MLKPKELNKALEAIMADERLAEMVLAQIAWGERKDQAEPDQGQSLDVAASQLAKELNKEIPLKEVQESPLETKAFRDLVWATAFKLDHLRVLTKTGSDDMAIIFEDRKKSEIIAFRGDEKEILLIAQAIIDAFRKKVAEDIEAHFNGYNPGGKCGCGCE